MWEVVLWLNIILACIAVKALESEPYYEFLFTRRNGYAYLEPLAVPVFNDGENSTVYIRNEHPRLLNTSSSDQDLYDLRQPNFEQQSLGQSNYISHRSKRHAIDDVDMIPDNQLIVLLGLVKPDELLECVLDKSIMIGCDYCVCMGGQLYICTSRHCDQLEEEEMSSSNELSLRSNIKFRNINLQPECIEGQIIRSFDRCNRCYCGGGQVLCTRKTCDSEQANRKQCRPGEKIPSPDGCNVCACNTRGFIVCTAKTCGPELAPNIPDTMCTANTWFSTTGNPNCKDCYCVNGKTSFCYLKLCSDENKSQRLMLKNSIQSIPGILPDRCKRLDFMQDECTQCYCNESLTWICRTEGTKKCAGKVPNPWGGNANKKPRQQPQQYYFDDYYDYYSYEYYGNYNKHKRPGQHNRRPKGKKRKPGNKGKKRPYKPNRPHKPGKDWTHKETPSKTTKYIYIPKTTAIEDYYQDTTYHTPKPTTTHTTKPTTTQTPKPTTTTHRTTTTTHRTTTTQPHRPTATHTHQPTTTHTHRPTTTEEPHFDDEDLSSEEPFIPPSQITPIGDVDPSSEEPSHIPPVDHFDPSSEEPFIIEPSKKSPVIIKPNERPHVQPEENNPDSYEDEFPSLEVDGFTTARPTKPSFLTTTLHRPGGGNLDTNVDRGPFCLTGQHITQSTSYNCFSCLCTSTNEWKCWSVKGPCEATSPCNPGRLKKNTRSACSVCYCGADRKSYCATDAACKFLIKPTKCDAVACMDRCIGSMASLGICHQDECTCIA